MNINLPIPPQSINASFMQMAFDAIRRAFVNVVSSNEAVQRILLRDSDGIVWEVTVDTSGNLQTAVNDGKSRV